MKCELMSGMKFVKYLKTLGIDMTLRTLRYYATIGLIPYPSKKGGNVAHYSAELVPRLKLIILLQEYGKSLQQIKDLFNQKLAPKEILAIMNSFKYRESREQAIKLFEKGLSAEEVKADGRLVMMEDFVEVAGRNFDAKKHQELLGEVFKPLPGNLFANCKDMYEVVEYLVGDLRPSDWNDKNSVRNYKAKLLGELLIYIEAYEEQLKKSKKKYRAMLRALKRR